MNINVNVVEDYINKLNSDQKKAATFSNGSVLVLAAAGSGKTSTLTSRIAYLIAKENIPPQNILAVTFTNKAAKEMISRLDKMGIETKSLWIGTFHGICNKILRYHALEAGIKKNFYIMDQQEQLSFLKRVCKANGYDPKVVNVNQIQDSINGYKENGWRSDQLRQGSQERKIYELYEQACLRDNCVDFSELMLGCYELFKKNPKIAEAYAEKFQHILVDEFQDTSELQYKWLKVLAAQHKNVFAVGDDDQCLVRGTIIDTAKGKQRIEDLKVGDLVCTKIGNNVVLKPITDIYEHNFKDELVAITLENGVTLESTKEHVWFVCENDKENDVIFNNITLTLCESSNNEIALHALEFVSDSIDIKNHLQKNGFNLNESNRIFTYKELSENYSILYQVAEKIEYLLKEMGDIKVNIIQNAKVGNQTLLHKMAKDITAGMVMVNKDNQLQVVKKVESIKKKSKVYDLNIENTHNYIANGIVTHNSIYSFRGAKPENLTLFKQEFNAELVKIEKNYRSNAYVLEAANAVIANNKDRQGKNLVPTKPRGEMVGLYIAFNDVQESNYIASEIKRLRRTGIPYKNMAILYRTNGQSRSLEKAMTSLSIPYIIYGGFRFFDRQEVKHAMAYLRLANNPNDNMAFLRVANTPGRAIGDAALKKLDALATENDCSLYEMAVNADNKTVKKFSPFIETINKLQAYCSGKSIPDMVRNVIIYSGLEAMYEKDEKDGEERLDNLYELISAAEVFVAENKKADLDEFLAFSTLETNVETKKRDENADAIKLMTVHASKGLEFEVVFISGLEEHLFPHVNAIKGKDQSLIEEERRLMYVALTRAKEILYLTYCEERMLHGQRERFIKSRFLEEIPKTILKRLN